jgi:acetyl esterase/lipase
MPTMPSEVQRDASLALRERNATMRVRVNWPTADEGATPPVLVFFSEADVLTDTVDAVCRGLCAEANMVVLSVRTADRDTATTALEWTADHATELQADPAAVLVGGIGRGGGLAATVALGTRDEAWPALTRQVLVRPDFADFPEALAEVAPATVVGAPGYSSRLREAGVEVEELDAIGELGSALRRAMSLDRIAGLST